MNDNFTDFDNLGSQSPEINFAGIDASVGLNNVLGDESLFLEILSMFYQDHSGDGQKLEQAISSNDYASLKHIVHTLKGVSCSVGAMLLFEKTKALDEAINKEMKQDYLPLYQALIPEFDKVMNSISVKIINK